ncbi:hypothetical protein Q3G72_020495 [Acer saccharum]|nr:hypothetical protein Q3G72_020495 [Acer saccharum]
MELHGFSSLSSKMAMPSSSSSHHERFLSSSLFFSTRVGAGQSNISISGRLFGHPMLTKPEADPKTVGSIILGGGAGTQLFPLTGRRAKPAVLAATQTPGESGKKWFHGTADAIRQFIRLFECDEVSKTGKTTGPNKGRGRGELLSALDDRIKAKGGYSDEEIASQHNSWNFEQSMTSHKKESSWETYTEIQPTFDNLKMKSRSLLELFSLNKDTTDYTYYSTSVELGWRDLSFKQNIKPVLVNIKIVNINV